MKGKRTVLSDRRGATDDEGGRSRELGQATLLPRRREVSRLALRVTVPDPSEDGRESERDGCGLIEGNVVGDLDLARQSDTTCAYYAAIQRLNCTP